MSERERIKTYCAQICLTWCAKASDEFDRISQTEIIPRYEAPISGAVRLTFFDIFAYVAAHSDSKPMRSVHRRQSLMKSLSASEDIGSLSRHIQRPKLNFLAYWCISTSLGSWNTRPSCALEVALERRRRRNRKDHFRLEVAHPLVE